MSRILQIIEQAQSEAARRDIQLPPGHNSIPKKDAVNHADKSASLIGQSHVELPKFGDRKPALAGRVFGPLSALKFEDCGCPMCHRPVSFATSTRGRGREGFEPIMQ